MGKPLKNSFNDDIQPVKESALPAKSTTTVSPIEQRFFGAVKPNFNLPPSFNPYPTTTTLRLTTTTVTSTTTSTTLTNETINRTVTDINATTPYEAAKNATEQSLQPIFPFDPFQSSTNELCAPFPPCNPLGCGAGVAPVNCPDCNSAAVGMILLGMCLLAILIVFTNILVIVVISRNECLRRRHGYIKISLATADLLIGLLVIPAAIYNLSTTLYIPTALDSVSVSGRFFRPVRNPTTDFAQVNSLASVFFGTILIISLIASIYNLLLLSADRFIAIAKPMQMHAGKYLSKKRLRYCLVAIWLLGLLLSSLPAFIPSRFSYQLDGTTFYFTQVVKIDSEYGATPVVLFSFLVMGVPYIATVILNLATLGLTIKKLKFRRTHSSIKAPSDPSKRMKMLKKKFPEIEFGENKEKHNPIWKKMKINSNNNSKEMSRDRTESNASTRSRSRSLQRSARELNTRVTKMILTMVLAFTVCMCPYIIVNISLGAGSLNCSNVGPGFNIAVYLILFNSAVNFFIYNLWHKEFRTKLLMALKRQPTTTYRASMSTSTAAMTSSGRKPRYTSSTATFGRGTASNYHMKKKKNGVNSIRTQKAVEVESHF